MFISHDFNLLLPTQNHLLDSLRDFNSVRLSLKLPPYVAEVEEDDFETYLFSGEDTDTYIGGEVTLPPADMTFRVYSIIEDNTPEHAAYDFIEFLCEKFKGTMVGVYVRERELIPIKIINGNRIPCTLVLIDDTNEVQR